MPQLLTVQGKKSVAKTVAKRIAIGCGLAILLLIGFGILTSWKIGREIKKTGVLEFDESKVRLPQGVPLYTNAKLEVGSALFNTYTYTTSDSVQVVIQFYEKYYQDNGYKVELKQKPAYAENPNLIDFQLFASKGNESHQIEVWNNGIQATHIIYGGLVPTTSPLQ